MSPSATSRETDFRRGIPLFVIPAARNASPDSMNFTNAHAPSGTAVRDEIEIVSQQLTTNSLSPPEADSHYQHILAYPLV